MIILYIKKSINNFRDLEWLNNEINFRTGNKHYPVTLKFNLDKKYIQKSLEVMNLNKNWKITALNSKEGKLTTPIGSLLTILDENGNELKLINNE